MAHGSKVLRSMAESETQIRSIATEVRMKTSPRQLGLLSLTLATFLSVLGCQSGMLPWVREEWRQDEEYTVTTHQQIEELQDIRVAAEELSPQEQMAHLETFARLLQNTRNPSLAIEVVRTLSEFSIPEAHRLLEQISAEGDNDVRSAVCRAWANRGGQASLASLLKVYKSDTEFDVRLAAVRGLGKFREPDALKTLAEALEDANPAMQFRAIQSLKDSTGEDFGDNLPAWREYLQRRGFATAAR